MNFIKRPKPVGSQASSTTARASAQTASSGNQPINLIFFGETGVGKSSLINTLANLLTFGSFDQAQQNEPKCVIPCSFSMTDENNNSTTIRVGDQSQNDDANLAAGDSVTQSTKSYFFDVNINGTKRKLHVIDTPGVGDPRGFEQDRKNIKNVIEYIKQFDGLNAICILLLPNASRFTLQFRYCFKELLTNLSRGSAPNICFCYTNSRSTFFKPGQCHPMLMAELEKIEKEDQVSIPRNNNFFCFDSEVFRFLAAKKQNIRFDEEEVKSFKGSWEKTNTSLLNLISYAANLPQASVKPIYLLSTARRVLMELSKPVAELTRNIQINKKLAEDKKIELENLDLNSNWSVDDLYIDQVEVEFVPLSQPKTVCSDPDCYKMVSIGGVQKINYNSDCHAPCYLDDVDVDVIAHPSVKKCHAFGCGKSDKCSECGHSWQLHLHVMRETREKQVQVLDQSVQDMIDRNAKSADAIEHQITKIEELIEEYEREQQLLIHSCAKLAKYIKTNGIMYYNPDLEEYLNLLIKEEESKKAAGGNNTAVIDGLRQAKAEFLSEVNILQSNLKFGGDEIATEADIQDMMDKLGNMQLNGNALGTMLHTPGPSSKRP